MPSTSSLSQCRSRGVVLAAALLPRISITIDTSACWHFWGHVFLCCGGNPLCEPPQVRLARCSQARQPPRSRRSPRSRNYMFRGIRVLWRSQTPAVALEDSLSACCKKLSALAVPVHPLRRRVCTHDRMLSSRVHSPNVAPPLLSPCLYWWILCERGEFGHGARPLSWRSASG